MILKIAVLWHTTETRRLSEIDIAYDYEDLEHREITLYEVTGIAPNYYGDGLDFCTIWSGGEEFISPLSYETVGKLIEEQMYE